MIVEHPPSRLREAEEDQVSDTTTTAHGYYCTAASPGRLPDRETATPLIKSRAWRATEEPP